MLVSFYGREWWSERPHSHMYFPKNKRDIVFSVLLSLDQNLMKT